jgi:hypothetical protein
MISTLKHIGIFIGVLQLGLTTAFVPRAVPSARSVHVNDMRSVGPLSVTIAAPTPTKSPDIKTDLDNVTDERTGRDPMWLVR